MFTCGASYFLIALDDYSRAILIYLIAEKCEVAKTLKDFFALKNQFHKMVKIGHSDNAPTLLV